MGKDNSLDSVSERRAAFAGWKSSAFASRVLRARGAEFRTATGRWRQVLAFLSRYDDLVGKNPHSRVFSRQMLQIAKRSYRHRKEIGGWAGDFTFHTFNYAVEEMSTGKYNWFDPPETLKRSHSDRDDGDNLTNFHSLFSSQDIGDAHFRRHLRPAFTQFINQHVIAILQKRKNGSLIPTFDSFGISENGDRDKIVIKFFNRIYLEHELFIRQAVIPGIENNYWLDYSPFFVKNTAHASVTTNVRRLRDSVFLGSIKPYIGNRPTFAFQYYVLNEVPLSIREPDFPIEWPPSKNVRKLLEI